VCGAQLLRHDRPRTCAAQVRARLGRKQSGMMMAMLTATVALVVLGGEAPLVEAGTTCRPPVVRKLLIIGNSLTRHGPNEALGWPYNCGMAATGPEHDYAHLTLERIAAMQPQSRPEMVLTNLSDEAHMRGFEHVLPCDADLVIIQVGDNYRGAVNEEELQQPYAQMIAAIRAGGDPRVFCVSTWGNAAFNPFLRAAAGEQSAVFVDIHRLFADPLNRAASEGHFTHAGVNWHPGDRGMAAIAETLWTHLSALWQTD